MISPRSPALPVLLRTCFCFALLALSPPAGAAEDKANAKAAKAAKSAKSAKTAEPGKPAAAAPAGAKAAANTAAPGGEVSPESIPLPEGVSALVSIRVATLTESLKNAGLEGVTVMVSEVLTHGSAPGLEAANVVSFTHARLSGDFGMATLVAVKTPLPVWEGQLTKQPSLAGWQTYKTGPRSDILFCRLNDRNVLMCSEGCKDAAALLPGIVRALSEVRAKAVKWPVLIRAGRLGAEGEIPEGSLNQGMKSLTIAGGVDAKLSLDWRIEYDTAARANTVAEDFRKLVSEWRKIESFPADFALNAEVQGAVVRAGCSVNTASVVTATAAAMKDRMLRSARAKNQRNAQNVVSLYQAAKSCGVKDFEGVTEIPKIISILEHGVTVEDEASPFFGKRFSIGAHTDQTRAGCLPFLVLKDDHLDYNQRGDRTDIDPVEKEFQFADEISFQLTDALMGGEFPEGKPDNVPELIAAVEKGVKSTVGPTVFKIPALTAEQRASLHKFLRLGSDNIVRCEDTSSPGGAEAARLFLAAGRELLNAGETRLDRARRHAQNLVSIYQAARSSGVTGLETLRSKEEALQLLEKGVTVNDTSSPFNGKQFRMDKVPAPLRNDALKHVKFDDAGLDYVQFPGR